IDDWVCIGSCIFDHWNLRFNLEANLESLDPGLTGDVVASFDKDFALSAETTLADWKARPLWRRVKQREGGWIDGLVVNWL
ncbi:phosphatidylserine/phosphatidylglycerophosphate/cardiolipin synthase family protein, partial [Pseudomonas syringae pv. tagetis]